MVWRSASLSAVAPPENAMSATCVYAAGGAAGFGGLAGAFAAATRVGAGGGKLGGGGAGWNFAEPIAGGIGAAAGGGGRWAPPPGWPGVGEGLAMVSWRGGGGAG